MDTAAPSARSPRLASDRRATEFSIEQNLSCAHAWWSDTLATANAKPADCFGVLVEEDIALFVATGHVVIPELIQHVRDDRYSRWHFHFHSSSGIALEPMRVGHLACYLIEAIVRSNPYFTVTARLTYAAPDGLSDFEADIYALNCAAEAYEQWYELCFDQQEQRFKCFLDDLPEVHWDYDLEAWPRWLTSPAGTEERVAYMARYCHCQAGCASDHASP